MKNAVKKILLETGLYKAPVDIVKLAEYYGLTILQLDIDYDGAILSNKEPFEIDGNFYNKVILININQIPTRKRFTIAHELAHWIKTPEKQRDCLFAHRIDSLTKYNKEPEINDMASELLMPKELVEKELKNIPHEFGITPGVVYHVANIFNVSYAAAQVRLEKLQRGL